MWKAWKEGIPTHEYRKQQNRDISVVMEIDYAMSERQDRAKRITDAMNQFRN